MSQRHNNEEGHKAPVCLQWHKNCKEFCRMTLQWVDPVDLRSQKQMQIYLIRVWLEFCRPQWVDPVNLFWGICIWIRISRLKSHYNRQDGQNLDLHQVSAPITDLAKKSIGLTAHTPLSHRIDRALKEYSESLPVIANVILFVASFHQNPTNPR